MKQVLGEMKRIPATILAIMNIASPENIPPPMEIDESLKSSHIILSIIDNFGLFECVYYKPKFLIAFADYLYTLETKNPYAKNVIREIITGGTNFNLLDYLVSQDKKVMIIGKEEYIGNLSEKSEKNYVVSDTNVYVEAAKYANRYDFLLLHFNDFEELYSKSRTFKSAEVMARKLITRTDSWLRTILAYASKNTLLIVISNNGRGETINYSEDLKKMREASLPIGIFIKKRE